VSGEKQSDKFKIGLIQHACTENLDTNLESAKSGIRQAAKEGAQIICLQEIFKTRYFCSVQDEKFFNLAEPENGPTVQELAKLAKELNVALVVPFFERRGPGVYYNSASVIDADGSILGTYRKMHIPDDPLYYEKYYFSPGDAEGENNGFRVFKTKFATIGVLICWDQWYPEAARLTSLMGAEVLFYPTAIGWHPFEKEEVGEDQLNAWQTIQKSHAVANGVYVAAVNRIGHEPTPHTDGIEFFGHSFITEPFGKVICEAGSDKPEVLVAECSRKKIEETRQMWPFFRDRRIDAYGKITSRYLAK
jgi:N-carbamoylputrescine amidase